MYGFAGMDTGGGLKMKHFEITVEDTIGSLAFATRELNYQGVNLLGIFVGQLDGKGHIAFVAGDCVKCNRVMKEAGLDFTEKEVVIARLDHISGAIHRAASVLSEAGVNIRYIYPLVQSPPGIPIVFRTNDPEKAREAFEKARITVVDTV